MDINFDNEKQGQDEVLCANITEPSQSPPDRTGGNLSHVREDIAPHAFIEKYSVWMSSLAVVTVVKTREHTAMNSIRAHDFNFLIMLTPFATGSHNRKKAGENLPNTDPIFSSHNEHSIFGVELPFQRRIVRRRHQSISKSLTIEYLAG